MPALGVTVRLRGACSVDGRHLGGTGDIVIENPPSYGDVTGEYLALRTGAGVVTRAHDLVWISGADTVPFLDGLLSQDVAALGAGSVGHSLLLTPQGKLRARLWLLAGDEGVGLVSDAGRGPVVAEDLRRFRIRVSADIRPEQRSVVDVWGPSARAVVEAAGLPVPGPTEWMDGDGVVVASLPFAAVGLPRLLVVGADAKRFRQSGAVSAGALAAAAVRIEAGEPVVGVDVDESTIPAEADLVAQAVSFTKGCYLGQELVARIESRGHVNRHLRGLLVRDTILPPPGAEIVAEEKTVGRLTSVAESLQLRAPVGLALLRREVQPGDEVRIMWEAGSARAAVAALPLDSFLSEPSVG